MSRRSGTSSAKPEIVVSCAHGLAESDDAQFIQRFRWLVGEGLWIGTVAHVALTPDGRTEMQCRVCGERVPARNERLVGVLEKVADSGITKLPLGALARALSSA